MSRYEKYPAYRDSGVEWIGEIPGHWEVKRLKHLLSEPLKYGANETSEETNPEYPRYIRITDIHEDGSLKEETFRSLPPEIAENYLLSDGDILLARSGATVGKTFSYNNSWGNAAFAGYLIRARVNRLTSASFLYKYFQSTAYWQWLSSVFIQATIQNVSAEKYANLLIPHPPLEEQQEIASFLDRKTAQIDDLITKKEELLKKLDEKRIALITQAVTKGLDPSAPMKESGVKWIGEIPKHWEVKRLKQTMLLITNKSGAETQNVALENIESWSGKYIPSDTEFEGEGVTFQVGDILFGKLRPYLAKAYLAEFPGSAVGDFHVMRPITTSLHGRYTLFLILNHGIISIIDGSTFGAKMPRVSWDFMGNLPLPVPPLDEQQAIAKHIEKKKATIYRQKAQVTEAIERLKEYRTALITNAVTGKIQITAYTIKEQTMPIQDDWNELLNIRGNTLSTIKHQTLEEKYLLVLAVRVTELCIDAIALLEKKRSAALPIILRSAIETYIHLLNILHDSSHVQTMQLSFNYDMYKFLENVNSVYAGGYSNKKKGPQIKELFNKVGESKTYQVLYAHLCMHSHSNISALITSHSIDGEILLGTTQDTDFIKLHTLIVVTLFADTLKDTLNQFKHDRKVIENIETIIERINNDPFMAKFHESKESICTENPTSSTL